MKRFVHGQSETGAGVMFPVDDIVGLDVPGNDFVGGYIEATDSWEIDIIGKGISARDHNASIRVGVKNANDGKTKFLKEFCKGIQTSKHAFVSLGNGEDEKHHSNHFSAVVRTVSGVSP
tara:strand:+ start:837 stop:1193 length:357 start_codon:yes stop_codon:yes gene_type:complete